MDEQAAAPHQGDTLHHHSYLFHRFRLAIIIMIILFFMYLVLRAYTAIKLCWRSRRSIDLPPTGPGPRTGPPPVQSVTPPPRYPGIPLSPELEDKASAIMRALENQGWLERVNSDIDHRLATVASHRAIAA